MYCTMMMAIWRVFPPRKGRSLFWGMSFASGWNLRIPLTEGQYMSTIRYWHEWTPIYSMCIADYWEATYNILLSTIKQSNPKSSCQYPPTHRLLISGIHVPSMQVIRDDPWVREYPLSQTISHQSPVRGSSWQSELPPCKCPCGMESLQISPIIRNT
jgi:hypothetical protein